MQRIKSNIQQKIMRIVLMTCGIVVFLACAALVVYQFYIFKQSAKDQLSTLGNIIAANTTASLAFQDKDDATETLRSLSAEKHIVAACLYDTTGHIFARYPESIPSYDLPLSPGAFEYRFNGSQLKGFQKVIQNDIWVGTLYLKSDLEASYATFMKFAVSGLVIFSLAILVAYLLSKRLQKSVSEPIRALSLTAGIISDRNDYSVRAKKFENDELGLLTDGFNTMLDEIQRQNAEIVSFNQDLELKVAERTAALRRAITDLRRQTDLFETVIDSSVDVIAVFDIEFRYVIFNRSGQVRYNLASVDVIGKKIEEVFPNIIGTQMYNDLSEAMKGQAVHNPYYESKVTNGILENFYVPLVDAGKEIYGVLVIGHDITATVESNKKLQKLNFSLEQSNRDLEQFAYIASHDLQEPLRKIRIFSSQLESRLDDKELTKKTLTKIIASAARMSDLISGVLNYSRLSNVRAGFEKLSLDEILNTIVDDLEMVISEKNAVIIKEALPVILGNRLQMNQLFSNLLSNSMKFCRQQPLIRIVSEEPDVQSLPEFDGRSENNKYFLIRFQDNGIGFSQQYSQNIFSVFQRLHSNDEYPGTGIGLALCKKIVQNHNGYISVESVPDEGTTFFIYLPVASV